jgi:hypothetical protein
MKKMLLGLVVFPFVAGIALAQEPMALTTRQMDKVTAGWDLFEVDCSNTSRTVVSVYQGAGNKIDCPNCYLLINSPAFSVASQFGPCSSCSRGGW